MLQPGNQRLQRLPKICEICGKEYVYSNGQSSKAWLTRRFCGAKCYGISKEIPVEQRFWKKVNRPSEGCWEWLGAKSVGYGRIFGRNNKLLLAPRFSWELVNGPIPNGLFICHTCDNPGCVNPNHLFLGTAKDNALDKVRKGRAIKIKPETRTHIKERYKSDSSWGVYSRLSREFNVSDRSIKRIVYATESF